jgi:hypothetical protein
VFGECCYYIYCFVSSSLRVTIFRVAYITLHLCSVVTLCVIPALLSASIYPSTLSGDLNEFVKCATSDRYCVDLDLVMYA